MSSHEQARALAIAQNFGPEALELNRRLVEANPEDIASRTRLARCQFEAGLLDAAEAEYREVLRREARNRIAEGGLEAISRARRLAAEAAAGVSERRTSRGPRTAVSARARVSRDTTTRRADASGELKDPAPQILNGFEPRTFVELSLCPRGDIRTRFGPRVMDLIRRVNALSSCQDIASAREPGRRQLFRLGRGEVQVDAGHWHVSSQGAGAEPQFDIGMHAGTQAGGDWLRVGMAFALDAVPASGPDPDGDPRPVRARFRRFQQVLGSSRRSLFLGWMIKEHGFVQVGQSGPRLDLREAAQAAELIAHVDPVHSGWVFFGRWLAPGDPADAGVLADPVTLVRTIDRVFAGLTPLWRAIME